MWASINGFYLRSLSVALLTWTCCDGAHYGGPNAKPIEVKSRYVFVSKFVMDWEPTLTKTVGEIDGRITVERESRFLTILDGDWDAVYRNKSLTCGYMLGLNRDHLQWLKAGQRKRIGIRVMEHYRPRIWYCMLLRCENDDTLVHAPITDPGQTIGKTSLELTFKNPREGYEKFFSMDQTKTLALALIFTLLYAAGIAVFRCREKRLLLTEFEMDRHPILRAVFVIIVIEFCACACLSVDRISYARYGEENSKWAPDNRNMLYEFGFEVLDSLSNKLLIGLLLLVAKGWAIVSPYPARSSDAIRMYVILALALVCHELAHFWAWYSWDPQDSHFYWWSWEGAAVTAARSGFCFWFQFELDSTEKRLRTGPKKKNMPKQIFYKRLRRIFSLWFCVLPASLLLGRLLPMEFRAKIFLGFRLVTHAVALLVLTAEVWPVKRNAHLAVQIQMHAMEQAHMPLLISSDEDEEENFNDHLYRFATL